MKLYTEEQVRDAIKNYVNSLDTDDNIVFNENKLLIQTCFANSIDIVEKLTPIELPSNEDIDKKFEPKSTMYELGFRDGAKWVIDKIKNNDRRLTKSN